jgi:hypothetical protein
MIFIAGINIQAIGPLLTNAANNCGSVFVWVKNEFCVVYVSMILGGEWVSNIVFSELKNQGGIPFNLVSLFKSIIAPKMILIL